MVIPLPTVETIPVTTTTLVFLQSHKSNPETGADVYTGDTSTTASITYGSTEQRLASADKGSPSLSLLPGFREGSGHKSFGTVRLLHQPLLRC